MCQPTLLVQILKLACSANAVSFVKVSNQINCHFFSGDIITSSSTIKPTTTAAPFGEFVDGLDYFNALL